MIDSLTPLQALHKLLDRWKMCGTDLLSLSTKIAEDPSMRAKAVQYGRAIMACHGELSKVLDGVEDGALQSKQPQPHETEVIQ